MELKQQAVLSEERLKQVQGLEDEHHDLKVQLKVLMVSRVFRKIFGANYIVFSQRYVQCFCLHLLYMYTDYLGRISESPY